jgi:transaldolase
MNRLQRLHEAGVSIWLDTLSRELLESGEFATLVDEYAVSGATSNPTIFAKAITGSDRYDQQLRSLDSAGVSDTRELFFTIALAYGRHLSRFAGERWEALRDAGATAQRPLWASTGTKDPGFSDVLYVEQLTAPGVINTMPDKTLRAFAAHGNVEHALGSDLDAAEAVLSAAALEGVDLETITRDLEHEGIQAFCDSYEQLLSCIGSKLGSLVATS